MKTPWTRDETPDFMVESMKASKGVLCYMARNVGATVYYRYNPSRTGYEEVVIGCDGEIKLYHAMSEETLKERIEEYTVLKTRNSVTFEDTPFKEIAEFPEYVE